MVDRAREILEVVASTKLHADLRLAVANSVDDPPDSKCGAGGPVGFQEAHDDHATEKDG